MTVLFSLKRENLDVMLFIRVLSGKTMSRDFYRTAYLPLAVINY